MAKKPQPQPPQNNDHKVIEKQLMQITGQNEHAHEMLHGLNEQLAHAHTMLHALAEVQRSQGEVIAAILAASGSAVDPAAISALTEKLRASHDVLTAAVIANKPVTESPA